MDHMNETDEARVQQHQACTRSGDSSVASTAHHTATCVVSPDLDLHREPATSAIKWATNRRAPRSCEDHQVETRILCNPPPFRFVFSPALQPRGGRVIPSSRSTTSRETSRGGSTRNTSRALGNTWRTQAHVHSVQCVRTCLCARVCTHIPPHGPCTTCQTSVIGRRQHRQRGRTNITRYAAHVEKRQCASPVHQFSLAEFNLSSVTGLGTHEDPDGTGEAARTLCHSGAYIRPHVRMPTKFFTD